ncbi:UDP-glycosyltransferase 82A1 [Gastrolobium bilobum]|uniref:UDP-glycosyltransferase 82A1 n=1 Tax=Gastrolobium bilobum TaxID=150636 RepID=UPI002AAFA711|nr:UDP-glycosyltransferase 82A1 [Gastrolobium bilobum]
MKHLNKQRIILVPYPAQGHVGPMQKLASAFLSHGFEPVIVLPQYIHHQILLHVDYKDDEIKYVAVPDGLEEDTAPDFFAIESAMENNMPTHLEDMLHKLTEDGEVVCLVVDLLASWAIEVANRFGIPIAGFWPAMLATYRLISAIPDLVRSGLISDAGLAQHEGKICFVPEMPIVSTEDLPWLIGTVAARKARFKFWIRTLERSRTLKWLLVNSFPDESKLEQQTQLANMLLQGCPRVLPISPICRNQLTKNLSFWEEDLSCLKWLSNQKANSVVYISFGSWVSPIGEAKLKSLALALEDSGRPFIWVLRSTWRQGLPIGFLERVFKQGKGRVVSWAPQTEILQHESVGCYVTHCGWNSTLEALQFQKRLLCYPVAGDQFVNCAYIVQVWRVGLKLNGLGQKDVEEGLTRVMEDKEMGTRLMKLYDRIMGMQGDNKRGAFMLKAFVDDLQKASSTIHKHAT